MFLQNIGKIQNSLRQALWRTAVPGVLVSFPRHAVPDGSGISKVTIRDKEYA